MLFLCSTSLSGCAIGYMVGMYMEYLEHRKVPLTPEQEKVLQVLYPRKFDAQGQLDVLQALHCSGIAVALDSDAFRKVLRDNRHDIYIGKTVRPLVLPFYQAIGKNCTVFNEKVPQITITNLDSNPFRSMLTFSYWCQREQKSDVGLAVMRRLNTVSREIGKLVYQGNGPVMLTPRWMGDYDGPLGAKNGDRCVESFSLDPSWKLNEDGSIGSR